MKGKCCSFCCEFGDTRVNFPHIRRTEKISKAEYATKEQFRELFADETNGLYVLSLLLTGDPHMAQTCLVTGLEECVKENFVFQKWAGTWARRIIVRNAVRMFMPSAGTFRAAQTISAESYKIDMTRSSQPGSSFANILKLDDFERFVYVLSVLEKYSDQETAVLLNVSRFEIREARARANRFLG